MDFLQFLNAAAVFESGQGSYQSTGLVMAFPSAGTTGSGICELTSARVEMSLVKSAHLTISLEVPRFDVRRPRIFLG